MSIQPIVLEQDALYLRTNLSPDDTILAISASKNINFGTPGQTVIWSINERRILTIISDSIASIDPQGVWLGGSRHVWDWQTGEPIHTFSGTANLIFSPDGTTIVGEVGSELHVFERTSGRLLHRLKKDRDRRLFDRFQFAQGNNWIMAFSYAYDFSDRIYYWDTTTGKHLTTFANIERLRDFEIWLEASPTGRFVTTRFSGVDLWELEPKNLSWNCRYVLDTKDQDVWQTGFSPDEKLLVTIGEEKILTAQTSELVFSVRTWNCETGQSKELFPMAGKCFCFAFSPDGVLLATMSGIVSEPLSDSAEVYTLNIWEVATGRLLFQQDSPARKTNQLYQHPEKILFSSNGRWVVITYLKSVELWDFSGSISC